MIVGTDQRSRVPEGVVDQRGPGEHAEPAHHHAPELFPRERQEGRRGGGENPGQHGEEQVQCDQGAHECADLPANPSGPHPVRCGAHHIGRVDPTEERGHRRVTCTEKEEEPQGNRDQQSANQPGSWGHEVEQRRNSSRRVGAIESLHLTAGFVPVQASPKVRPIIRPWRSTDRYCVTAGRDRQPRVSNQFGPRRLDNSSRRRGSDQVTSLADISCHRTGVRPAAGDRSSAGLSFENSRLS